MIKVKVVCSQVIYLNRDVVVEFEDGELPASVIDWLHNSERFPLVPYGMLNPIKSAAIEAFTEMPVEACDPEPAAVEIGRIELVK